MSASATQGCHKQQYLPTFPHNIVNFGPLAAEIGSVVWGTPANFKGFHVLALLLQRRRSAEANQTLYGFAVSWAGTLHCVSKNVSPLTCHILYRHGSIATIFGKNVAEKVGNQNVLYFPTSPN